MPDRPGVTRGSPSAAAAESAELRPDSPRGVPRDNARSSQVSLECNPSRFVILNLSAHVLSSPPCLTSVA